VNFENYIIKVKSMKKLFLLLAFGAFIYTSNTTAQISTPAPSPAAMIKQTVGLTDVSLEYSRPGMKGRTIFASDGLVPFGKLWRTGANQATKITFSDDVMLGGSKLAAGSYALLTTPSASEWEIHFHKHESGNWGSYADKVPALTVNAASVLLPSPISIENFTIGIGGMVGNKANIEILWENTYVEVPFEVEIDAKVTANIEKVLSGPSNGDYYAAGTYYLSTGKNLDKALKYVRKATKSDKPMFWQVRTEALILAEMGNYSEAISTAKKSIELAKAAKNDDYVANNKKSITEWKAKM